MKVDENSERSDLLRNTGVKEFRGDIPAALITADFLLRSYFRVRASLRWVKARFPQAQFERIEQGMI